MLFESCPFNWGSLCICLKKQDGVQQEMFQANHKPILPITSTHIETCNSITGAISRPFDI